MVLSIISLMGILLIAQIALAIRQIKKGAPDGRILLTIDIIVLVIWTPICVLKILYTNQIISVIWFLIALAYMIFTTWYTNMLGKSFKR